MSHRWQVVCFAPQRGRRYLVAFKACAWRT